MNGTPLENARLRGYAQAKQRCLYPVRLATIGRRLPVMEGFCDFEDWDTVLGICAGRISTETGRDKTAPRARADAAGIRPLPGRGLAAGTGCPSMRQ